MKSLDETETLIAVLLCFFFYYYYVFIFNYFIYFQRSPLHVLFSILRNGSDIICAYPGKAIITEHKNIGEDTKAISQYRGTALPKQQKKEKL